MSTPNHPQRFSFRRGTSLVALAAVASGFALVAAASDLSSSDPRIPQTFTKVDTRPAAAAKAERPLPSERLGVAMSGLPQVALAPVDVSSLVAEDEATAVRTMEKKLRIGVGRGLNVRPQDGSWFIAPNGDRLWAMEVVSPGAVGLRLHFDRLQLPAGAELAVYGASAGLAASERSVEQVSDTTDLTAKGGWTRTIPGERARVELAIPQASAAKLADRLPFVLDQVQHLYADPLTGQVPGVVLGAGSCHNDISCNPAWLNQAKAVARITFVVDGDSFLCTGQLVEAQNDDLTPYFLTANHCISDWQVAPTLQAFWNFQTTSCGGSAPSLGSVPTSTGAKLLSNGAASDFSFLMIEGTLPTGRSWMGWTSGSVATGTASACIHHPAGDLKKISFGTRQQNPACNGIGGLTNSNHVKVDWTDGPTEGGSSGSAIYKTSTGQLYGQLHCGPSSCADESNDSYGAFSATFPSISSLLAAGSDDVGEDNDVCPSTANFIGGTLSNMVVKSLDSDWFASWIQPGQGIKVVISFTHANGDIDAKLYNACGASPVSSSTGTGNTETLTYTNNTANWQLMRWNIYLYSDTRNNYSMTATFPIP